MIIKLGKPRAVFKGKMESSKKTIFQLREDGYSFCQISVYLASIGIKVTPDGVRKFIIRERGDGKK